MIVLIFLYNICFVCSNDNGERPIIIRKKHVIVIFKQKHRPSTEIVKIRKNNKLIFIDNIIYYYIIICYTKCDVLFFVYTYVQNSLRHRSDHYCLPLQLLQLLLLL